METWELVPYKSVGPICFTDIKEDIVKKLGKPERCFEKKGYSYQRLIFADYFVEISTETKKCGYVCPSDPEKCKVMYGKINLNDLNHKKTLKELFKNGIEIYGDFSSFPIYVIKELGISIVTAEHSYKVSTKTELEIRLELSGLEIFSNECFPELSNDDILITCEDQIL